MFARTPDVLSTVLDREMGDERPASDRIAMERARARTELALFGHAEPAQIGRYVILEPIASGGMGFVYAAYDPELERQVALKVLHPARSREDSHARLLREARALARLDHPRVVRVHDVLSVDEQIVIVMELVEGETLASWEAAAPRSWREVVAAYVQAGEGLAAAHELDVIHRDFKPSNAVIGDDGRVRVLDFGLALLAGDDADAPPAAGGDRAEPGDHAPQRPGLRTASGTIMGTPGYAAPEQLSGGTVTAASDQFSFCVALHRAVEGVAPFGGAPIKQLVRNIGSQAPRLAGDGRRVPRWLREALRRGLAGDPAHRHPSMRALLAELTRPRGWRRWRRPVAAALLVGASVAATMLLVDDAGVDDCDGGAAGAAAVWGPAQRLLVGGRLAARDTPYAREVQARVLAGLDARTQQWSSVHRAACRAHRSGAESAALLDRKMLCLRQRLDEVAAAIAVLGRTGGGDLGRAIDVVAGMPAPSMCADAARLIAEGDAPLAPELRPRVAAVRGQIAEAAALGRAGRDDDGLRAIEAARRLAEDTGHAPVIAEAQLAHGRALLARGEHLAATPVLRDAMTTALASNLTRIALEAAARRIYTEGVASGDVEQLRRELDYVDTMSRSLVGDRFVRPLLLNNVGVAYMAAKRSDDALRYFRLARAALTGEDADLELLVIDQNLAMLTPDAAERARLARGVWLRRKTALGEHHLATLEALLAYASFSADARTAHDLIAAACAGYRRMHPALLATYASCEVTRGFLASEAGERDATHAAYAAVVDATAASTDPNLVVAHHLAAGELAVLGGRRAQAIEHLGRVIEARGASERWWVRKEALQAELGLGLVAAAAGDRPAAVRHLETAATGFAEIAKINQGIVYRLRLSRARHTLDSLARGSRERRPADRH